MNDQSHMMNRNFGIWRPPPPPPEEALGFQISFPTFGGAVMPGARIRNWSDKKSAAAAAGISGYKPPTSKALQSQNRAKARRFYPNKKKHARFAPFAPRNTTSFIIRAKKSGGIASLVSPCPVTPAILPTPKFSPSREGLIDMAKEEWGVDGYGSMKGLIRLRSPARADDVVDDDVDDSGSSESDVEEHLVVERRLDHDLSRFEMVYPSHGEDPATAAATYILENRVDDQDTQITQLEDENLTLKERMFVMEQEMAELRRRLQLLEDGGDNVDNEDENNNSIAHSGNGVVEEDELENDAAGGGDVCSEKIIGDCEDGAGDGDGDGEGDSDIGTTSS